jgi:hypothetical protein
VTPRAPKPRAAQAWIELLAPDPEAVSALAVARAHLPGGEAIQTMRRLRLFEISGPLPGGAAIADLLHRSIQFYNPRKERCTVRLAASDPAPFGAGEGAVLVVERGGARREAAERWWRHETGEPVTVREGVAWIVGLGGALDAARLEDLAVVRDRRHGLLCNPHAQDHRIAAATVPLPWIAADEPSHPTPAPGRRTGGG